MSSRLREPFGKAGLIVAVVALVMALVGGAYAANSATDSGKHRNKRGKRHKRGPKFVTRPQAIRIAKKFASAGPAGPQGPKGDSGSNGSNGSDGSDGHDGTDGKSVEVSGTAGGCAEGGATVQVEGEPGTAQEVCNGKNGTFEPSGFTQTGAYWVNEEETTFGALGHGSLDEGASGFVPLSFPIPLESPPTPVFVPGNPAGEGTSDYGSAAGCPGVTSEGVPQAEAGKLCVYAYAGSILGGAAEIGGAAVESFSSPTYEEAQEGEDVAAPTGTLLKITCGSAEAGAFGICYARGLWAVHG